MNFGFTKCQNCNVIINSENNIYMGYDFVFCSKYCREQHINIIKNKRNIKKTVKQKIYPNSPESIIYPLKKTISCSYISNNKIVENNSIKNIQISIDDTDCEAKQLVIDSNIENEYLSFSNLIKNLFNPQTYNLINMNSIFKYFD